MTSRSDQDVSEIAAAVRANTNRSSLKFARCLTRQDVSALRAVGAAEPGVMLVAAAPRFRREASTDAVAC